MGKKKNKQKNGNNLSNNGLHKAFGRRYTDSLFNRAERSQKCLYNTGRSLIDVIKLDFNQIKDYLAFNCRNIEQQIVTLRELTQLTEQDYHQRYNFTKMLLNCLFKHHRVIYEGILFGSTINGLGFMDSDVDLKLRPLTIVGYNEDGYPLYEPALLDDTLVERTLRDIAYQTTKCSPALSEFVPSSRCPVAKLTFLKSPNTNIELTKKGLEGCEEGLKYDISLSANNFLGPFNSLLLRFFCHLEPKFHLLATVVRYWSSVHHLIVPGLLSSYALVNMLIYFCQTTQPPLLPTIDHMRKTYLANEETSEDQNRGLTQLEWSCLLSLDKESYEPSKNTKPLSFLLLEFFEMYLKFPYSTHIITTRPGRALSVEEYKLGPQFHPRFPINQYLNIQDPFDLRHNLTSGMQGEHFLIFMLNIRESYERLHDQLMNNFCKPSSPTNVTKISWNGRPDLADFNNWGLNAIFVPFRSKT